MTMLLCNNKDTQVIETSVTDFETGEVKNLQSAKTFYLPKEPSYIKILY